MSLPQSTTFNKLNYKKSVYSNCITLLWQFRFIQENLNFNRLSSICNRSAISVIISHNYFNWFTVKTCNESSSQSNNETATSHNIWIELQFVGEHDMFENRFLGLKAYFRLRQQQQILRISRPVVTTTSKISYYHLSIALRYGWMALFWNRYRES